MLGSQPSHQVLVEADHRIVLKSGKNGHRPALLVRDPAGHERGIDLRDELILSQQLDDAAR